MRRRTITPVTVVVASFLLAVAPIGAQEYLAMRLDLQVIASDRAETGLVLSEWAESAGGYFTFRSLERVTLRVPNDELPGVQSLLEARADEIVVAGPSTVDLRAELRDVEAAIESRRESLDRILAYLEDASITATLAFERELRALNAEVEALTGRRRTIENRSAFATIDVALSVRERTIPGRLPSSFEWINTVDLYDFIDDMSRGGL